MGLVTIEHEYVNIADINKCIEEFKRLFRLRGDSILRIEANVRVEDIDVLFFAYLLLFKNKWPQLQITISLPLNTISSSQDLEYKIKQFGTYCYLMTRQSIFGVSFADVGDHEVIEFNLATYAEFPTNWLVLSEHFMPLLFVQKSNEQLFKIIFEQPLQDLHPTLGVLENSELWSETSEKTYNNLQNHIIKNAYPPDTEKSISDLGRIAFYKILHKCKILSFYLDPRQKKDKNFRDPDLQAGNLSSKKEEKNEKRIFEAYDFYRKILPIIDELTQKPLVYQFVFSIITSSHLLPGHLTKDNKKEFTEKLYSLWNFSKDMVHGLKELAKNTREHTTTGTGVMTGRVYAEDVFRSLHEAANVESKLVNGYLEHIRADIGIDDLSFLDFNVIDLGDEGVIKTLLDSTEKIFNSIEKENDFKALLKQDIQNLTQETVSFKHLLHPETTVLNQQTKRSIAHLGLLTFVKLLRQNRGLLKASTTGIGQNREMISLPHYYENSLTVSAGTNYHIVLPINPQVKYQTFLPSQLHLPHESSEKEIKGLEELFKYQTLNYTDATSVNKHLKNIFTIDITSITIATREDEGTISKHIENAMEYITAYHHDPSGRLICIDCKNVQANGSNLFRILGRWENDYPNESLIITNIANDVFFELTSINKQYWENNRNFDYWNAHSATIIYSFVKIKDQPFYFVDALWGKTQIDYIKLNKSIKRTNFNASTLFNFNDELKLAIEKNPDRPKINSNIAFYNDNMLLPLDILLAGMTMSIFEHNSSVLLRNEIKPLTLTDY